MGEKLTEAIEEDRRRRANSLLAKLEQTVSPPKPTTTPAKPPAPKKEPEPEQVQERQPPRVYQERPAPEVPSFQKPARYRSKLLGGIGMAFALVSTTIIVPGAMLLPLTDDETLGRTIRKFEPKDYNLTLTYKQKCILSHLQTRPYWTRPTIQENDRIRGKISRPKIIGKLKRVWETGKLNDDHLLKYALLTSCGGAIDLYRKLTR